MIEKITGEDWQSKVLEAEQPVLVDFYAEWCGPCKSMAPIVDEIAAEKAGQISVYKLDIDEDMAIARDNSVMSIPTLIVFKGGQSVAQAVGVKTKEEILAML